MDRRRRPIRCWSAGGCGGSCPGRSEWRAAWSSSAPAPGSGGPEGALVVLARPWARPARARAAARRRRGLDPATLRDVQIHYVAAPVFVGVDDPVFERIAILPGYEEVKVPALMPASTRPALARARPVAPRPFAPSSCGGFLGSAERYAEACLRRLALAPDGQRHNACLRVACRLLAIARAGQLDPVAVGARIIGRDARPGFDAGLAGRFDPVWAWKRSSPRGSPMSDELPTSRRSRPPKATRHWAISPPRSRAWPRCPVHEYERAARARPRSLACGCACSTRRSRPRGRDDATTAGPADRAAGDRALARPGRRRRADRRPGRADPAVHRAARHAALPSRSWVMFAHAHARRVPQPAAGRAEPVHRCGKSTCCGSSACWWCARWPRRASRRRRCSA